MGVLSAVKKVFDLLAAMRWPKDSRLIQGMRNSKGCPLVGIVFRLKVTMGKQSSNLDRIPYPGANQVFKVIKNLLGILFTDLVGVLQTGSERDQKKRYSPCQPGLPDRHRTKHN